MCFVSIVSLSLITRLHRILHFIESHRLRVSFNGQPFRIRRPSWADWFSNEDLQESSRSSAGPVWLNLFGLSVLVRTFRIHCCSTAQ
jgi:hypothetical protein